MSETKNRKIRWILILWGVFGAAVLALPELFFGYSPAAVFGIFPLGAIVGLVLVVIAFRNMRSQTIATLMMLLIFCYLAWAFFQSSYYLRTAARWLADSGDYKSQVLSQSNMPDGMFKHVEWEGWGFPGAGDTTEHLVFDPDDRLGAATKGHLPAKFSGIPCPVVRVQRLERNWYTVRFYTDTDWNDCGETNH